MGLHDARMLRLCLLGVDQSIFVYFYFISKKMVCFVVTEAC